MTEESVLGADVARWQGTSLDFQKISDAGVKFCFAKATHGATSADPTFKANWAKMKGKIIRGPYFWFVPEHDVVKQVDNLLKTVGDLDDEDLPYAIDFEQATDVAPAANLANVLKTVRLIRSRTGRKPFLYTGKWYWAKYAGDVDCPELVAETFHWHAEYPTLRRQKDDYAGAMELLKTLTPHVSKPWAIRGLQPDVFQFDGDKGLFLPGGVDADFDKFYGSIDDLRALIKRSREADALVACVPQRIFERKDIQLELIAQGFSVGGSGADGMFGPATKLAVASFQAKVGLKADGIVGPNTLKAINDAHAARLAAAGVCA